MDGRANERTNRRRTEGRTGVKITINNFAYTGLEIAPNCTGTE